MQSWGSQREVEKVKRERQAAPDGSIMAENDALSVAYPSVELPTGERLHVYEQGGCWSVWLNTEAADFDGICVAREDTRDEAAARAVRVFEAAIEQLQRPVL